MSDESKALAAVCVCGGWVMLACLGHSPESDRDQYKEAGILAGKGFEIRHGTVEEFRHAPLCKHRGDCTTRPSKVKPPSDAEQLEAAL